MLIEGVEVENLTAASDDEIRHYIRQVETELREPIAKLKISRADGGKVQLDYVVYHRNFERIRRITGYLVGTIDRWNNAKKAEERERVKHG